jgi:hypothetical protein
VAVTTQFANIGFRLRLSKGNRKYWNPKIEAEYRSAGIHLAEKIKRAILDQVYDWTPLTERYEQWKEEQGLDRRILIATGSYVWNIDWHPIPFGVEVTVPDRAHRSGMTYKDLGRILEYGSFDQRIPPRPHWRPVIREWKNVELRTFQRKVRKLLVGAVRKDLRDLIGYGLRSRRS